MSAWKKVRKDDKCLAREGSFYTFPCPPAQKQILLTEIDYFGSYLLRRIGCRKTIRDDRHVLHILK